MRKLSLVLLFTLLFTLHLCFGAEVFKIFWNSTGVYIVAYPIRNITVNDWMINAFYDLSGYKVWKFVMTFPAGTNITFTLGNYTVETVGGSSVTINVPPDTCIYIDALKRWYCGFNSGESYTIQPLNSTEVVEAYNACITIVYQPITENPQPLTATVQVYDFYTQRLLKEINFTEPSYATVCGVADIVLLNITMGNQWLGMYYLAQHLPTIVFPSEFTQFGALIPLAFFIALAVKNRTKLGGIGAIIYGFLFSAIVVAFGLQNIFPGNVVMLISSLSIFVGAVMLLFSTQRV